MPWERQRAVLFDRLDPATEDRQANSQIACDALVGVAGLLGELDSLLLELGGYSYTLRCAVVPPCDQSGRS